MSQVGSIYRLKRDILGNSAGTIGVVYEIYGDLDGGPRPGMSLIFPNGNYDGFSFDEQDLFLEECGFCRECSYYKFKNVMVLSRDFTLGYFKPAFENKGE